MKRMSLVRDHDKFKWCFETEKGGKHEELLSNKQVVDTVVKADNDLSQLRQQISQAEAQLVGLREGKKAVFEQVKEFKRFEDSCKKVLESKLRNLYGECKTVLVETVKEEVKRDVLASGEEFLREKLVRFRHLFHTWPKVAKEVSDCVIRDGLYGGKAWLLSPEEVKVLRGLLE